mgnify:CR=1 FL=1
MTQVIKALAIALALSGITAVSGPAKADDVKDWQRSIAMAVAENQTYPRSALRRQLEGTARVKITIDRSGTIASFEVVEATGHNALDRTVPKLMERLSPLPAPPSSLGDNNLTFILPLAWRLQ